jgi:hypothetical protein
MIDNRIWVCADHAAPPFLQGDQCDGGRLGDAAREETSDRRRDGIKLPLTHHTHANQHCHFTALHSMPLPLPLPPAARNEAPRGRHLAAPRRSHRRIVDPPPTAVVPGCENLPENAPPARRARSAMDSRSTSNLAVRAAIRRLRRTRSKSIVGGRGGGQGQHVRLSARVCMASPAGEARWGPVPALARKGQPQTAGRSTSHGEHPSPHHHPPLGTTHTPPANTTATGVDDMEREPRPDPEPERQRERERVFSDATPKLVLYTAWLVPDPTPPAQRLRRRHRPRRCWQLSRAPKDPPSKAINTLVLHLAPTLVPLALPPSYSCEAPSILSLPHQQPHRTANVHSPRTSMSDASVAPAIISIVPLYHYKLLAETDRRQHRPI